MSINDMNEFHESSSHLLFTENEPPRDLSYLPWCQELHALSHLEAVADEMLQGQEILVQVFRSCEKRQEDTAECSHQPVALWSLQDSRVSFRRQKQKTCPSAKPQIISLHHTPWGKECFLHFSQTESLNPEERREMKSVQTTRREKGPFKVCYLKMLFSQEFRGKNNSSYEEILKIKQQYWGSSNLFSLGFCLLGQRPKFKLQSTMDN